MLLANAMGRMGGCGAASNCVNLGSRSAGRVSYVCTACAMQVGVVNE